MSMRVDRGPGVFTAPKARRGDRTKQSEKDACDVNLILKNHLRGGVTAHVQRGVAEYGFVPALDFRACMEQVRQAREVFESLPSETRAYFLNDPARFVDFTLTPGKVDELVANGLLVKKEVPAPPLGSVENPIHVASPEGQPT